MQIALIGNPNSGKTVLFNELTGANQHVGNWPGVTVEQKRGQIREQYGSGELVDLPGIYSLSPFSMEEIVSRDFLLNDQPDVVINIIDATNLERNLYLSIQLIELNAPMVMALNMMDEVEREGFRIDTQRLSDDLGVPVVGISATQRWGLQELMAALENAQPSKRHELPNKQLERLIKRVEVLLARHLEYEHNLGDAEARGYPLHWVAIKVLESDELVFSHLTLDDSTMQAIDSLKADFEQQYGPLGSAFADARYQLIHEMIYRDVTVWAWDGSHHHHLKHAPEGYLQLSHEENEIFSAPHFDDEETSSDEHSPTHEQHRDGRRSRRQIHDSHHQRNHHRSERENHSEHESHLGAQPIDEPQDQPLLVAQPLNEQSETEWLRDEHSIDEQKRDRYSADRHDGFSNRRFWQRQRGLKPKFDHHHQGISSRSRSDAIDRILTHRVLAMPIFLVVMFLVFHLTFGQSLFGIKGLPSPGVLMQDIVRAAISALQAALYQLLGTDSWLSSLINEGIIGGVGTVLTFVPQIILLFFFLSLMEDCGYMARAAFIMDRLLRRFGLSGKSFLPMLMGFGCTVPAVMAARTMENPVERRLTLMLVPFMSCGARTPIYLVMAGAFFPAIADLVVFGLYLLGIVVAVLSGILLRKMLFKGDVTPFIIELPRYRAPQMRSMLMMLWEKLKDFLVRAGTIIFAMCVVLWLLSNFGIVANRIQMCDMENSFLVAFGQFIAPIFAPLGFGFWIAAVAILTGFVAKESVISTLGTLLGIGSAAALEGGNLSVEALSAVGFTPLSALSFMVFCLLYVPCVAAFASLKREFASWRWAIGQAGYSIATAYICAFLVYQIGSLLIG